MSASKSPILRRSSRESVTNYLTRYSTVLYFTYLGQSHIRTSTLTYMYTICTYLGQSLAAPQKSSEIFSSTISAGCVFSMFSYIVLLGLGLGSGLELECCHCIFITSFIFFFTVGLYVSYTHPTLTLHSPYTDPTLTLHSPYTHPILTLH